MFINERLLPLARAENLLIVHPHAQRTGGKTFRNKVLAAVFGKDKVFSRSFGPAHRNWRTLREGELEEYRAYSELSDYGRIGLTRPHVAVALMRDPLHRAVSLYGFARDKATHRHHAAAMNLGIEEFFRQVAPRDANYFNNVQCRRICGYADAPLALRTLQSDFIGLGFTSSLGAFVEALSGIFGWSGLYIHDEKNGAEKYATEITPGLRALIQRQNAEDMALFDAMANGAPYRIASRPFHRETRRRLSTAAHKARNRLRGPI